jgi:hypothetical protein
MEGFYQVWSDRNIKKGDDWFPAIRGAIKALTTAPAIPGITAQLQGLSGEGWQWALSNLREAGLLAKAGPPKPVEKEIETIDCHPLIREYFAAITHGCAAGLHQEALDEVYWPRIKRGNEHYCIHKLGAFGAELAALPHFFEKPWSQPAAGLTDDVKAVVLSWVGFGLRAMGRLSPGSRTTFPG